MSRSKIQRLMNKFGLFCPIEKLILLVEIAKAIKTNNYVDNLVIEILKIVILEKFY